MVCVCVLVGKEPVPGSPTKSKEWPVSRTSWSGGFRVEIRPKNWEEIDWQAGKRTSRTVLVTIPIGTYQKCCSKRPKGTLPYGGRRKPVRIWGMWETVVGSISPYGICIRSPVRWFVNNRTVYMDMWTCDACWKPIQYCKEKSRPVGLEIPYGV